MNTIEDRGFFWWSDEPVPQGQFAPSSAIAGTLKIDEVGEINLDLDLPLSTASDFFEQAPVTRNIFGIIRGDDRRVTLVKPFRNRGKIKPNGISFETFGANCAITGPRTLPNIDDTKLFRRISVELIGLDEWLCLGSIDVQRSKCDISAEYKHKKPYRYKQKCHNNMLYISSAMNLPWWSSKFRSTLQLEQRNYLSYSPSVNLDLTTIRSMIIKIEEFMILMTNGIFITSWPILTHKNERFLLYYTKSKRQVTKIDREDFCLSFPKIREKFGELFFRWLDKLDSIGPGLYLYLATRRKMEIYIEHRFLTLVMGLESLHRAEPSNSNKNEKLVNKINRILCAVEPHDKRWLERILKNSIEPSLEGRMFDVFRGIPINLDKTSLRKFCKKCATLRNKLVHEGAAKERAGEILDTELLECNEALSLLYYAVILQLVGVDNDIIYSFIHGGPGSYKRQRVLASAGLPMLGKAPQAVESLSD